MFQKKAFPVKEDGTQKPAETKASQAKKNKNAILFISAVSVLNLIFALMDVDTVLLFSPGVPYYLTRTVQAFENNFVNGSWESGPATMTAFVFALLLTAPYFVCSFLCKKSPAWVLTAAILMAADTLGLVLVGFLFMDSMSNMLMDFVMHAVMLAMLFAGWKQQKKLYDMVSEDRQDPDVLRYADPEKF